MVATVGVCVCAVMQRWCDLRVGRQRWSTVFWIGMQAARALRQKQKGGRDRSRLETWLRMKKLIYPQQCEIKSQAKERQSAVQTSASVYFNWNYSSASGTRRPRSNLLDKADSDGKRGLLFHQIASASLNTFECLHQFRGFYCGGWFHLLARNITATLLVSVRSPGRRQMKNTPLVPETGTGSDLLDAHCTATSL